LQRYVFHYGWYCKGCVPTVRSYRAYSLLVFGCSCHWLERRSATGRRGATVCFSGSQRGYLWSGLGGHVVSSGRGRSWRGNAFALSQPAGSGIFSPLATLLKWSQSLEDDQSSDHTSSMQGTNPTHKNPRIKVKKKTQFTIVKLKWNFHDILREFRRSRQLRN